MAPETERLDDYSSKPSLLTRLHRTKLPLWVGLLLLVLLIVAFAWSWIAAGTAGRQLAEERQQLSQKLEAQKSSVQLEAQETISRHTRDLQVLFGTALAWSVRSAMLRNNLDEVDQYFGDLVKNPRIALVLLADTNGKVLRASDRKYLDTGFSEHFPAALLEGNEVAIHPDSGNRTRLALPIQGLTSRLGTVLLVYAPPA